MASKTSQSRIEVLGIFFTNRDFKADLINNFAVKEDNQSKLRLMETSSCLQTEIHREDR